VIHNPINRRLAPRVPGEAARRRAVELRAFLRHGGDVITENVVLPAASVRARRESAADLRPTRTTPADESGCAAAGDDPPGLARRARARDRLSRAIGFAPRTCDGSLAARSSARSRASGRRRGRRCGRRGRAPAARDASRSRATSAARAGSRLFARWRFAAWQAGTVRERRAARVAAVRAAPPPLLRGTMVPALYRGAAARRGAGIGDAGDGERPRSPSARAAASGAARASPGTRAAGAARAAVPARARAERRSRACRS
jgi:hypothetical protein